MPILDRLKAATCALLTATLLVEWKITAVFPLRLGSIAFALAGFAPRKAYRLYGLKPGTPGTRIWSERLAPSLPNRRTNAGRSIAQFIAFRALSVLNGARDVFSDQ